MGRSTTSNETKPLRVCFIVTVAASATNFYSGYLSYLSHHGWHVTLITNPDDGVEEFAQVEGVEYLPVPMKRDPSPIQDLRSLVRLVAALRRVEPDVLAIATPKAGLLGVVAGRLTRVKVRLYQLWGLRLETEVGLKRRLLHVMEKMTAQLATDIVANSPSLADRATELGLNGSKNVKVLGKGSSHGVDLEKYSICSEMGQVDERTRSFLEQHTNCITIGFIGRIHKDKGLDILFKAVDICRQRGIEIATLVLGRSEDQTIRDLVDLQVADGHTHYVGRVADPRPYMISMDIHCLPTLREGFPNVVLEASALGVPTVTTTATGAVDSVVHGLTGLLVPPGDAESLAASLGSLAKDGRLREKYGQAAQRHVRQYFTRSTVWSMNMELLTTLARSGKERSLEK